MRAALVLAVASCSTYTHVATTNAPGNADVTTPMARENGDPARFEEPADPGTHTLAIIAIPSVLLGVGRQSYRELTVEPGLELRFEHHDGAGREPFGSTALAITAGMGFAQIVDRRPTILGPFFAELSYRFPSYKNAPTDIGVGPAFYADGRELGAQISVRMLLLELRGRYMADHGLEVFFGFTLPIPFLFGRSR